MNRKLPLFVFLILLVANPALSGSVDFSFTTLEGKTFTSAELIGTPLVVNISAHWWKKGKKEAPEFQRAYLAYKDRGVVFFGVFASKEKDIRTYVDELNLTYPVGKEDGIADALGVKGVPRTIFIDKKMRIVSRLSGPLSYEELDDGIKRIIADDPGDQAALQGDEATRKDWCDK